MASASITVSFNNVFGSNGAGNDQFNYPKGVTNDGSHLYIVDTQNHRIKKHEFDGTYVSDFGAFGTGNDQFSFPEDILYYDGYLYITDSANHRVKKHQTDGTYVLDFGSNGAGNNEFDYPVGIDTDNINLFIVDRQNHRIKQHQIDGTYVSKFGYYGAGNYMFNHPEGIAFFDSDKMAIVDSGNSRIIVRRTNGNYLYKFGNFDYPTGITETGGIFTVVGRQDNTFYFYDYDGNIIDSVSVDLNFPISATYYDGILYITDSANHRIKYYDLDIVFASSAYLPGIISLTKQLYPTGRAWIMKKGSIFYKFHDGLAYSESRIYAKILGILDSVLPDNDDFSEDDADNYERALAVYQQSSGLTLSERKNNIKRKLQHPGNILGRQAAVYIEYQLQLAGFDVYIHENRPTIYDPVPAIYGEINYNDTTYGNTGISGYTKIANYVDELKDSSFSFGDATDKRATFFVGGEIFPNFADVPADRKNEFRDLILRLKPAQMAGYLLINYV